MPSTQRQLRYKQRQSDRGLTTVGVIVPIADRQRIHAIAEQLRNGQSPALADSNSPDGLPAVPDQEAQTDEALYPNDRRPVGGDRTRSAGDCRGGDPMNISAEAQNWLDRFFALSPESQNRVRRHILFTSCGQLDTLMPDSSEEEKQDFLDRMVECYHRD